MSSLTDVTVLGCDTLLLLAAVHLGTKYT